MMDEHVLVANVQAGDRGAFDLLVSLHFRSAYNMAYRFMGDHGGADEVVQQSFLKAYNAIAGFRREASFKSWLLRIVCNTAKNVLRSRGDRTMVSMEDVTIGQRDKQMSRLEEAQTGAVLRKAIALLPPKQRQALELRIFEDLSFKEVADVMECPFDTAKANFRHALQNLRKILDVSGAGEEMRLAFEGLGDDDGRD